MALHEVMDLLKQDDSEEPVNNYTASPAVDTDSDEDSGDEDDGGLINNLNANQLRATAETVLPNGRLGETETADLSNPSQTSRVPPKRRKTTQKSSLSYKWSKKVKTQLKPNDIMDSHPVTLDFSGKSPLVIFEFFFDDETLSFIVEESKRYACQKRVKFTVSLQDMKTFFGILLFSGYHLLPSRRMYWSVHEDYRVAPVAQAMSRNRFKDILRFLHFNNNQRLDTTDKMTKLRPLMDRLNKKFMMAYLKQKQMDLDEAMIKYFGPTWMQAKYTKQTCKIRF